MNARKLMFVGLAVIIALGSLFAVACGDDESSGPDPKATMSSALAVIEDATPVLTDQMMAGGTGADIKAALVDMAPSWQAVVDACEGLDGADAAKAQEVWDDLKAASDSLADDADLTAIAATVMDPVMALTGYAAELRELVGPAEGATADTAADE